MQNKELIFEISQGEAWTEDHENLFEKLINGKNKIDEILSEIYYLNEEPPVWLVETLASKSNSENTFQGDEAYNFWSSQTCFKNKKQRSEIEYCIQQGISLEYNQTARDFIFSGHESEDFEYPTDEFDADYEQTINLIEKRSFLLSSPNQNEINSSLIAAKTKNKMKKHKI